MLLINICIYIGTVEIGKAIRSALVEGNREAIKDAATFEDGVTIQRILDACGQSHETKSWVAIQHQ